MIAVETFGIVKKKSEIKFNWMTRLVYYIAVMISNIIPLDVVCVFNRVFFFYLIN